MSSKKKNTKSSKSGTKAKRAAPKKAATRKKQAVKRSSAAQRGWETRRAKARAAENARLQKLARARATRERRNTEKLKRSVAARKGWQTRREKPKAVRTFEQARAKKQAAELKKIDANFIPTKWDFEAYRYYDEVVFPISKLSAAALLQLMRDLKNRGIRYFRYEREVPVNLLGESSVFGSPSGFASTEYFNLQALSLEAIENGKFEMGLPSIKSMRVRGIDYARKLVVKFADLKGLPKQVYATIKKSPVETRDSIKTPEEWGYYLRYGKRMSKKGKARLRRSKRYLKEQNEE